MNVCVEIWKESEAKNVVPEQSLKTVLLKKCVLKHHERNMVVLNTTEIIIVWIGAENLHFWNES